MIHFCNVSKSMSAWPMVFSIFSPHSVILSISSPFAIFNPSTVCLKLSAAFTRSFKASRCLSVRCALFVVRRDNSLGFLSSYRDMFQFCLERLLCFVEFRWFCSHSKTANSCTCSSVYTNIPSKVPHIGNYCPSSG